MFKGLIAHNFSGCAEGYRVNIVFFHCMKALDPRAGRRLRARP